MPVSKTNIAYMPGNDCLKNIGKTDHLTDFLFQDAYEEPQLLQRENELVQQMNKSIQTLNQILEALNIPEKEEPGTEWITTKMVQLKYGLSLRTQASWRESGKLPFTTVEFRFNYKKQDLENLFSKGYQKRKNQESTT